MIFDNTKFEHKGLTFRFNTVADEDHGAPWEESDCHGIVSDWTTRDKHPGERVLSSERNSKRYYDIPATMKIARAEWGIGEDGRAELTEKLGRGPTKGEIAAHAVESDFEYLRAWCNDEWSYVGVVVTHIKTNEEGEEYDGESDSLWGIESDEYDYHEEVAHELADNLARPIIAQALADSEIEQARKNPMPKTASFDVEVTDTFGGEANYCWVKRYVITVPFSASRKSIVREAKKAAEWTGVKCRTSDIGDSYEVRPVGVHQVMFINLKGE
jgi:hypothetical protein